MDHDSPSDCDNSASEKRRREPGRTWTKRVSGPIRYRRFTARDTCGAPGIFFSFDLPPGERALPQAVYGILQEMKYLQRRPGDTSKPQPSGLRFVRDKKLGHVWKLPPTPSGQLAADLIDAKLTEYANTTSEGSERAR